MATNFQGAQHLKIGIHKKFAEGNFTDGESQIEWETVDIVLRKAKHDKDFLVSIQLWAAIIYGIFRSFHFLHPAFFIFV